MKFFVLTMLLPMFASASIDLGTCAQTMTMDMNMTTNGMEYGQPDKAAFKIENGKIVINKPDQIVTKEVTADKEIYTYKVDLGNGVIENRKLEVIKSGNSFIVRHIFDSKAQEKAFKEMAKKAGFKYQSPAQKTTAMETSYQIDGSNCLMTQMGTTLKSGIGSQTHISFDSKYCGEVGEILKKHGKDKVQECAGMLDELNAAYDKRDTELLKEKKTLREPFMKHGMISGTQNTVGALVTIGMCAPQDWKIKAMNMTWGMGMYSGTGGAGMTPPPASTAPAAGTPATR